MLHRFFTRLRHLFSPVSTHDLDEELQFHLDQAIRANVDSGMSPEEARRRALVEFGGIQRTREQCAEQRPAWLLETTAQDLRYAIRGFRRNPAFTITVIATLALGIGATTAVFSVVDRILFRSLPYAHDDRLVSVGLSQPLEKNEFTLGGFFFEWRDNQKPFQSLTFERGVAECNLTETSPVRLHCGAVAANFLPTLGVDPILGRNFLPEEDVPSGPKVALISYALWLNRYNCDPEVLDKTISIDNKTVRIIGVLPKDFEMPRLQVSDVLFPAAVDIAAQHAANSGIGVPLWAFARLKPGVSIAEAKAEMDPLYRHTQLWIPPQIRKNFTLQIRSIRDRQMQSFYTVAWTLLGAVVAVLLIACANVASLFMARAAARERELAVRMTLGASRSRLLRQTFLEAFLLAFAGAVTGCILAEILLRIFIAIAPTGMPFLLNARLDLRIVLFTVAIAFFCSLLFGIIPALQKPRLSALSTRTTGSGTHARLRRLLVVTQIALCVVLLAGASLLLQSFKNLEQQKLGLETHNVLILRVPLAAARYQTSQAYMDFYLHAEKALRQIPGIESIAISDSLPPDADSWHDSRGINQMLVGDQSTLNSGLTGSAVLRRVTPAYFHVLGIPIVKGRGFTEEERTATDHPIVVSQLLASRLFAQDDPLDKQIRFATFNPYLTFDSPTFTVVGVAANVKNAGLAGQDDPEYYELRRNHPEDWSNHNIIALETSLPASVIAPWIRAEVARLDPTAPIELEPLTQSVRKLADRPRFEAALLSFFASSGLIMAIVGLYGVITFIAIQRTQEIGVRMALGATRPDIFRLIADEGIRLILLGGALGLVAAFALTRLLKGLLFGVRPHDFVTYLTVTLLLAIVALAATFIPARSAMKVEPVEALRHE